MAEWKCSMCGFKKEGRCKPKKCPECDGKDCFEKDDTKDENKPCCR